MLFIEAQMGWQHLRLEYQVVAMKLSGRGIMSLHLSDILSIKLLSLHSVAIQLLFSPLPLADIIRARTFTRRS